MDPFTVSDPEIQKKVNDLKSVSWQYQQQCFICLDTGNVKSTIL